MPQEQAETLESVSRHYAQQDSPGEPGAQSYRFKAVKIEWDKGSAAGYIAKYIAKNIDGHGLDTDETAGDPQSAAERVDAWASVSGIRQFQQVGGPPVTIWHALRRLAERTVDALLHPLWSAANAGKWATFVTLLGDPTIKRSKLPLGLHRVRREGRGFYGDPLSEPIGGLTFSGNIYLLPVRDWIIQRRDDFPSGRRDEAPTQSPVAASGVPPLFSQHIH